LEVRGLVVGVVLTGGNINPTSAAEIASTAIESKRPGFAAHLSTFPGDEFERNLAPARDVEL
jgi:hypothetical protein